MASRMLRFESWQRRGTLRRRRPPHFRYLDSELAKSYLSDLLGWLPEEASSTERSLDSLRRDQGLRYRGTGFGRETGEESSSEDIETFSHTPQSIFRLLYDELDTEVDGEKYLVSFESLNKTSWDKLQDGDFVEIIGTLKIPEVIKAAGAARELDRMLPLLDAVGDAFGEDIGIDQQQRQVMSSIGRLSELGDSARSQDTVVVIELYKTPNYRFVTKLKRDCLRMSPEDLEGNVKVLGTVVRKINKGDPPIGFEQFIPGLEALRGIQDLSPRTTNRAERRAKGKRGGFNRIAAHRLATRLLRLTR